MAVRAKFKVTEIKRGQGSRTTGRKNEKGYDEYEPCEMRTIVLSPVYSTDPMHENKKFWDATPNGKIELGVVNPGGYEQFELGREYYVDFTEAD